MERLRYLIGLLTLAAAIVGASLLWELLSEDDRQGTFAIQLEFRDARGLKAGADVRHRGVLVGSVRRVELRDDGSKAVVTVLVEPQAEDLVRVDSKFWIVTPRFGGLTGGASGLDTLIRNAYLSFRNPVGDSPRLSPGSVLRGLETPWYGDAFDPPRPGDLSMTVLVPENHGLSPGAAVMFRGMQTGEVRDVQLAPEGTHVEVLVRIAQRHRRTVTDEARWWIARPRVEGAIMSGFAVRDLGAIVAPFLSYYAPPGEDLRLVPDGHRVAALPEAPEIEVSAVPESAVSRASDDAPVPGADGVHIARVLYTAREVDWTSADDEVRASGPGLFYRDRAGRHLVVAPRSLCDGSYFFEDTLGTDPDIEDEVLRVQLDDGTVLRAGRLWVDPEGRDLAVLQLDDVPASAAPTPASRLSFAELPTDGLRIRGLDTEGRAQGPEPLTRLPASPAERRGWILLAGERAAGMLGQDKAFGEATATVALAWLPPALRP